MIEKKVIVKNCAPFTDCITEIKNTQIGNAKDIDVVMPMYNLIEHSDKHFKTLRSLWQHYRDELALNNNGTIIDFSATNNNSVSFKFKRKITSKKGHVGTKIVKIKVSLTLEMLLINCEINLTLIW